MPRKTTKKTATNIAVNVAKWENDFHKTPKTLSTKTKQNLAQVQKQIQQLKAEFKTAQSQKNKAKTQHASATTQLKTAPNKNWRTQAVKAKKGYSVATKATTQLKKQIEQKSAEHAQLKLAHKKFEALTKWIGKFEKQWSTKAGNTIKTTKRRRKGSRAA